MNRYGPTSLRVCVRRGEILGKIAWIIALMLSCVWVLGHWLLPTDGVSSIANSKTGLTGPSNTGVAKVESNSLPAAESYQVTPASRGPGNTEGSASRNASVQNSRGTNSAALNVSDSEDRRQWKVIRDDLQSLVRGNKELTGRVESVADIVDQNSETINQIQTATTVLTQKVEQQKDELLGQINRVSDVRDSEKLRPTDSTVPRTWTMTNGGTATAVFAGLEDDVVLLEAKGKTFRVQINKLIQPDRDFARQASR